MFDPSSRYADLPIATREGPDGRVITFVTRRFLPRGEALEQLTEHRVREGDRMDRVAAKTLGSAAHGWRIADANDAMNPATLTDEPGVALRVPVPGY